MNNQLMYTKSSMLRMARLLLASVLMPGSVLAGTVSFGNASAGTNGYFPTEKCTLSIFACPGPRNTVMVSPYFLLDGSIINRAMGLLSNKKFKNLNEFADECYGLSTNVGPCTDLRWIKFPAGFVFDGPDLIETHKLISDLGDHPPSAAMGVFAIGSISNDMKNSLLIFSTSSETGTVFTGSVCRLSVASSVRGSVLYPRLMENYMFTAVPVTERWKTGMKDAASFRFALINLSPQYSLLFTREFGVVGRFFKPEPDSRKIYDDTPRKDIITELLPEHYLLERLIYCYRPGKPSYIFKDLSIFEGKKARGISP